MFARIVLGMFFPVALFLVGAACIALCPARTTSCCSVTVPSLTPLDACAHAPYAFHPLPLRFLCAVRRSC